MNLAHSLRISGLALAGALFVSACGQETAVETPRPTEEPDASTYRPAQALAIEADLAALEVYDPARGRPLARPGQGLGNAIRVPAGSVDALGDAIQTAGPGGLVVVEAGVHFESASVEIGFPVVVLGERGAIVETGASRSPDYTSIEAAFYVNDAGGTRPDDRVIVSGLTIRAPAGTVGGYGFLVEDTDDVAILYNTVTGMQGGVALQDANDARILGNRIEVEPSDPDHGIVVINGVRAGVARNTITGAFFGLWACDRDGFLAFNDFRANTIGLIYCKVPSPGYALPSGDNRGADLSATNWYGAFNTSRQNAWGYMVIDGSTDCTLAFNDAADNAFYDVHVVPDTEVLFGFCTPSAVNTTVVTLDDADVIKDCGINSTIVGGTLVDPNVDPCEPPCSGGVGRLAEDAADVRSFAVALRDRLAQ